MVHRGAATIIAAMGVVIIGILVLAGMNLVRAANSGPRWKRRLIQAGLFALASLGIAPVRAAEPITPATRRAEAGQDITGIEAWRGLVAVWREADEVASGKRGMYPFSEAGKKQLLERLNRALDDVESLRKSATLTDAEAGLLRDNLRALIRGVEAKRPTEMKMATCYRPMMSTPVKDSLQRLADRLPLLKAMAEQGTLRPGVVERILPAIEADLKTLSEDENYRYLNEETRKESKSRADAARREFQPLIERIRELAGSGVQAGADLGRSKAWQHLVITWREAEEVGSGRRGMYPFDQAGRKRLLADLKQVSADAESLRKEGLLTDAEAALLQKDIPVVTAGVEMKRATEERAAMCYAPMPGPSAQDSVKRLSDRLPLIRKMIDEGRIKAAVAQRILPIIEADLKVLSEKRSYSYLDEAGRKDLEAKAGALRRELTPLVERLKRTADTR